MCSGKLYSIREAVDIIADLCEFKDRIVYDIGRPETISSKHISNEKLLSVISRKRYTNFSQGLSKTIEWVKSEIARNA
jgi:nucleoside-diphosphate-sugar epimerase